MSDRSTNAWQEALERGATARTWRDVEELLDTPEFRARLAEEFPAGAETVSRRGFLSLLGASAALAGLSGCMQEPRDKIVPYTKMPPDIVPERPLHYATSFVLDGFASGLLVTAREGRPIKVEGNPQHPATLGASGPLEQAVLLQLYDPQRSRAIQQRKDIKDYADFVAAFAPRQGDDGDGLRILMEPTSSLLVGDLIRRLREVRPKAKVYFYSPVSEAPRLQAMRSIVGQAARPVYDFSKASVIVSIDDDFLNQGPFWLRYSRQFASRRTPDHMNRLYVVEPTLTITGGMADHRYARRPSHLPIVVAGLLAELGGPTVATVPEADRSWIRALARDLQAHRGDSLVVAGAHLPPEVHAAVHFINDSLGNVGKSVQYLPSPVLEAGEPSHDLRQLAEEIRGGQVKRLVILEANPAYTAPAELDFASLISKVPSSVYLGLYHNETAARTEWFVPAAHLLESWGDARAADGTISIVQPLISPLYDGKTGTEILGLLLGDVHTTAYRQLREFWMTRPEAKSDADWERFLQTGFLPNSAFPALTPAGGAGAQGLLGTWKPVPSEGIEVEWRPDIKVYDGRFANVSWLQEYAEPVTKQSWGNAARISPKTAVRLGILTGQVLKLSRAGHDTEIAAMIVPGQTDDVLSLTFGYGRMNSSEELCWNVGGNAYRIWTSDVRNGFSTASVQKTEFVDPVAVTQAHWSMEGRDIARGRTLDEHRKSPGVKGKTPFTLYDSFEKKGPEQWSMAIDLSLCTGCSSCVVACFAENNIPMVGKEGVLKSREMHWIRIDRYFTDSVENPGMITQPMLCQHCEKAPCEYVCPVNATTHSPDGLNEMTYNRCVGTRFCSNNCPYKVRRFNWFDYNAHKPPTLKMLMNPQVTVRGRGVIEKCTYCVQRIRNTQIKAQIEQRPIRDGELQVACQQACPTTAIVFGNLLDPNAAVTKRLKDDRIYAVLDDLGTNPRTRYLVRMKNPNPEMG